MKDQSALHSIKYSYQVDTAYTEEVGDLGSIAESIRAKCSSLKMASRIIGAVSTVGHDLSDEAIIQKIAELMARVSLFRDIALEIIEVTKETEGYFKIFNALTAIMIDVVTEEWKWQQLSQGDHTFSKGVVKAIFQEAISLSLPSYGSTGANDLKVERKVAIMDSTARIYGLPNIFDYFQPDREKMLRRIIRSIVDEVNKYQPRLVNRKSSPRTHIAVLHRMFDVSTGLMCEIYKAHAKKDVEQLRAMPDLDRALLVAQYERLGSMRYDHILESHSKAMVKVMDTANALFQSSVSK